MVGRTNSNGVNNDSIVELIGRTLSGQYSNGKVTSIGSYAFADCSSLEGVVFPRCSNVELHAFDRCATLREIVVGELDTIASTINPFSSLAALEVLDLPQCTSIVNAAFPSAVNIVSVYLPKLSRMGTIFSSRKYLETIDLAACESIAASAFNGCSALVNVNAPNCTIVSANAFKGCTALTELSFPMLESTGTAALAGCTNLEALYVGGSGATFGTNTFQSCTSLKDIWLDTTEMCSLASTSMFTGTVTANFHVPESLYDSYVSAARWSKYASLFVSDIIRDGGGE